MVGPYRRSDAAVKAVETVDTCLGRVAGAVESAGGAMLITADHGNAEMMRDPDDRRAAHRAHDQPVPVVLVNPPDGVAGSPTASSPTSRQRCWR